MNLRNFPTHLNSHDRAEERRRIIERELNVDLGALSIDPSRLGSAEEKNCEQMFGHVPIPVGLAGPLLINFSSGESQNVYLPLATTEAALVASVNRGCKTLTMAGGVKTKTVYHGITRSIAFKSQIPNPKSQKKIKSQISNMSDDWKTVGESTSSHLEIIGYTVNESDGYVFLTVNCDTDEAMGMNMATIAAQAIGEWIEARIAELKFITVAGNVDSDKKPSKRTHDLGRGYEVCAEAQIPEEVITEVLRTTPEKLLECAKAKLEIGSKLAGAIGSNLHAANIISALYLATGQDSAHVVEGSLADTDVEPIKVESRKWNSLRQGFGRQEVESGMRVAVRCPAILVGIRGGGTQLPAQKQCLDLLLNQKANCQLPKCQMLAESIGAAVLAGEISLLAAQATHTLAKSHKLMAR